MYRNLSTTVIVTVVVDYDLEHPQQRVPEEIALQEIAPQEIAPQVIAPQEIAPEEIALQELARRELLRIVPPADYDLTYSIIEIVFTVFLSLTPFLIEVNNLIPKTRVNMVKIIYVFHNIGGGVITYDEYFQKYSSNSL
ncbi:hypothetical protein X777_06544 [Ooceraea biroi]|uniref:Uncharacterized protein n=1 Tax=Ooceraea biroi TaxID=2015173 RepID=A0A026WBW3_OOCBI|nr:hypothetical protein X777_06544 [Ooceraea biroi]